MAFKKLGVAALTALIAVVAFIVFSPKHESSGHDASIASAFASQSNETSPTLGSTSRANLVAADFGAIICPDSKAITAYKDASTAWTSNNQPNMSAEEFEAAAKGSVEGLAKSAGCNYVVPGTSLVSEGGVEGRHGYGANLNLSVTAQIPDGTTIRGLTLPIMTAKSQQQSPTAKPETQQVEVKPTMGQLIDAEYLNEHYGRAAASACEASADNFLQGARGFDWAGFTWDTSRAGKKFDSYNTDAPFGQPIPGELAEISHKVKMLKTDGSASGYQITLQCNYSTGGAGKVIGMGISETYVDGVLQP